VAEAVAAAAVADGVCRACPEAQ